MPSRPTKKSAPPSQTDPNAPVRVAYYRRGSTDEENQPYTLDAQLADMDRYMKAQPTWHLVADFTERMSAKDVDGRPEFKRLLKAAAAGEFDLVLVAKLDRWSRNLVDADQTVKYLQSLGVAFHSVAEPMISTAGPQGVLMLHILATFAEFERSMIIDRIRRGNAAKVAKGLPLNGRVGYGLRVRSDGVVEADPNTIGVVRRIFNEYATSGQGVFTIAQGLTRDGIPNPSGREWSRSNISQILSNRMFIGEIRHQGQWLPGAHEPIISVDLFERVADLAGHRAQPSVAASRRGDFLLTGVLRCGRCGGSYTGVSAWGKGGNKFGYYVCRNGRARGKAACAAPSVPSQDLETLIIRALATAYADSALFDAAVQSYLDAHVASVAPAQQELDAVRAELARKRQIVRRYRDDYEAGDLDARQYRARSMELDAECSALDSRLATLEALVMDPVLPVVPTAEELSEMRQSLAEGLQNGSLAHRKALVSAVVESVTIWDLDDIKPVLRLVDAETLAGILSERSASGANGTQGGEVGEVFAYRRLGWS